MQLGLNAILPWKGIRPDQAFSVASRPFVSFYCWTANQPQAIDDGGVRDYFSTAPAGSVSVALIQRSQDLPDWQQFLRQVVGFENFGVEPESLGAIIFVAVDDGTGKAPVRWVGWCFGTAIRSLRRYVVEPRFGLLAALNAISATSDPNSPSGGLQAVKYRVNAPYFQQASHRATRRIPIEGFRLDPRSDLITEAGGSSDDALFGDVLGGRSFRFVRDVPDVQTLVSLSQAAFSRAAEDTYKGPFAYIDNIAPVTDENSISALRQALADLVLVDPTPTSVDVMFPDDLPKLADDRQIRYVLYPYERADQDGSVTFQVGRVKDLLKSRGADALDSDLRFLDTTREILGTATVLECLTADFAYGGDEYITYDGSFFRVSSDFVKRVNDELKKLSTSSIALPCHNGELEGPYNARVAQADPEFLLLDKALIQLPGETTVEAADLLHTSGALVHVKRGARSNTLSHLFFQVQNSSELLRRSSEFTSEFASKVKQVAASVGRDPTNWEFTNPARPAGPEVVFAFMGVWKGRTVVTLPLFSRVGLVQTVQRLTSLGFNATVRFIDVC